MRRYHIRKLKPNQLPHQMKRWAIVRIEDEGDSISSTVEGYTHNWYDALTVAWLRIEDDYHLALEGKL